jgi:hypothetical protein
MFSEQLLAMCKEYQAKICEIESNKYDTEKEVEYKDYMVSHLKLKTFSDLYICNYIGNYR